jgi:predicted component of type VI protein secretion system
MARLTLTFKGKSLQVMPIEAGEIGIGRDPANALQIDSLAIAPRHAVIQCGEEGILIRQLDQNYPLLVNNRQIKEHRLNDGDRISIGKHVLHFADDGLITNAKSDPEPPENADEATVSKPAPQGLEASFQVMKGKHIGLVIPIKSALTRLGKDESGSAVVIRRNEGYFLSALSAVETVLVNDIPVNDQSVRLQNKDIVKVNQHVLQFFC